MSRIRIATIMDRSVIFLTFLTVVACILIVLKVTWVVFFSGCCQVEYCECLCGDETMRMSDLEVRIRYRGPAGNNTDCSCRSFLEPEVSQSLRIQLRQAAELCTRCSCSKVPKEKDNGIAFDKYFTVVMVVLIINCFFYFVWLGVSKCIYSNPTTYDLELPGGQDSDNRINETLKGMMCMRGWKRRGYENIDNVPVL